MRYVNTSTADLKKKTALKKWITLINRGGQEWNFNERTKTKNPIEPKNNNKIKPKKSCMLFFWGGGGDKKLNFVAFFIFAQVESAGKTLAF